MSDVFSIIGAILSLAGLSFFVAAAARFGWDTAGMHTRKAPTVTNTYVTIKGAEPHTTGGKADG